MEDRKHNHWEDVIRYGTLEQIKFIQNNESNKAMDVMLCILHQIIATKPGVRLELPFFC